MLRALGVRARSFASIPSLKLFAVSGVASSPGSCSLLVPLPAERRAGAHSQAYLLPCTRVALGKHA
eukprot:10897193-Alexandrium_andersonii.AAC.1